MKKYLALVKFGHTIFALPFALLSCFIALELYGYQFFEAKLLLVLICMVTARNAAMAFNRYLDRGIDALNPRTSMREIPAGALSPRSAMLFVLLNASGFVVTTWFINMVCFILSPVAILVILGYSYTKRFTWLCHLVLGLGLALAPIGAYLAVSGQFDLLPLVYGLTVLTWVAGFDIIYALQDVKFDREHRLFSIPSIFGGSKALTLSGILHVLTGFFLIIATSMLMQQVAVVGWLSVLGATVFILLLWYQHTLVRVDDLSRVNLAFFTTNGIGSLVLGFLTLLDILVVN
jgi:4-hydroxybenzoate polyprenyltransferase